MDRRGRHLINAVAEPRDFPQGLKPNNIGALMSERRSDPRKTFYETDSSDRKACSASVVSVQHQRRSKEHAGNHEGNHPGSKPPGMEHRWKKRSLALRLREDR